MKMKRKVTPAQKKAAEERRRQFGQLVRRVQAMTQQQRDALVNSLGAVSTCEGRALSMFNSCLILNQLETASMVGGYRQWQAAGRQVNKGEHGLAMWFPIAAKRAESSEPSSESEMRFGLATVFDISQTSEIAVEAVAA